MANVRILFNSPNNYQRKVSRLIFFNTNRGKKTRESQS